MALEIFRLMGSIMIDNDKANDSLAKTDKKAQGVGSTLLKGVGSAAKFGAGLATAAGLGVSAITGLATGVADTAGAIDDASKKVGMSAESYQKWAYAAKLGGIESSKLESIMVKQQKSFADAKTGSTAMSEAYQKLGIDLSSISNSEEAFDQVMANLADMEDETQRNALANDIFGKSYADLAPLLAEGSDGIAKLKQEAVDLGGVLSNEAIQSGAEFGDTIDRLKTASGGLFNALGTSVIPIVQQFAELLLSYMPMIQGVFAQLAPVIATVFTNLVPPIMSLVETLLPTLITLFTTILPIVMQIISEILPIFTELLNLLLPPLMEIVQALLPPLLEVVMALTPVLQTVIDLLKPILDLFLGLLKPILNLISSAIAPLMKMLAELINTILKPIIPIIETLAKVLSSVLGGAFQTLSPIIDNIKGIFGGLITFISGVFTGNWKKAFQGVSDIVKGIFEAMVNIVKAPINFIIKGINFFISGLNKLKIPDWVPGIGGYGIDIPEIPLLAKGGTVTGDGNFISGEAGAELITKTGNSVTVTPLTNAQKKVGEEKSNDINLNMNLNIENFNNSSDADIEEIADLLAFQTEKKLKGRGLAYA